MANIKSPSELDGVKFDVGARLFFSNEVKPYKIRACNERYLVCTKPYNPKQTVLYTIVDLHQHIRGRENLIFCAGFESDEDCKEALARLASGESQVSHRHHIALDIVSIQ